MNIRIKELFGKGRDIKYITEYIGKHRDDKNFNDIHIIRFYSSYVVISNGSVIEVTEPYMVYCPLAESLYKDLGNSSNPYLVKEAIKKVVESKISKFGHFKKKRELFSKNISIPYGASEILMYALKKKLIDAAVVVCDGAGTVIVEKPEIVQGIGSRMNGIFYTSPIKEVMEKLGKAGSHVVFPDARIDQVKGIEKAASLGYKKIAVTVNASMDDSVDVLGKLENELKISLTSLAVCTTGLYRDRVNEVGDYADIVWSCASDKVRKIIGEKAIIQLSKKIPVFVLTKKGIELISSYSSCKSYLKNLELKKQYIICNDSNGKKLKMGNFNVRLNEAKLPVRDSREPILVEAY
jgi:putative methanogenesis marker protein 8